MQGSTYHMDEDEATRSLLESKRDRDAALRSMKGVGDLEGRMMV